MLIVADNGTKFENELLVKFKPELEAYEYVHQSVTLKDKNSLWKVSSAMQKSIRRGYEEFACKYVQALVNGGQADYIWRRLPVIALEDIGPGDYEVCALVLAYCRYATFRKGYDPTKLACFLVSKLCRAVKSRALTDVLCSANFYEVNKRWLVKSDSEHSAEDLLEMLCTPPIFQFSPWEDGAVRQAYVARRLAGDRTLESEEALPIRPREPDRGMYLGAMEKMLSPAEMYCLYVGMKKSVHKLEQSIPAIHHLLDGAPVSVRNAVLPDVFIIGGVIEQAFDWHNQEGKRSLAYFAKAYQPVAEFFKAYPVEDQLRVLGMLVFHMESGLLDRMLVTPELDALLMYNNLSEYVKVGLTEEAGAKLEYMLQTKEAREALRLSRIRVVEGKSVQIKQA
jgi:hypothetical protein